MTVNSELVLKTLDTVKENLDRWDQESFVDNAGCGTTHCFGGWALVNSGYGVTKGGGFTLPNSPDIILYGRSIEEAAREVLGLTQEQAEEVFFWFPSERTIDPFMKDSTPQGDFKAFRAHVLEVTGITDEESK